MAYLLVFAVTHRDPGQPPTSFKNPVVAPLPLSTIPFLFFLTLLLFHLLALLLDDRPSPACVAAPAQPSVLAAGDLQALLRPAGPHGQPALLF